MSKAPLLGSRECLEGSGGCLVGVREVLEGCLEFNLKVFGTYLNGATRSLGDVWKVSGKYLEGLRVEGLRMVFGRCLEVLSQVRSYYFFLTQIFLGHPKTFNMEFSCQSSSNCISECGPPCKAYSGIF